MLDSLPYPSGVGDVVDARACARDGEEIRARDELVHLGASHEDGIGLFEFLGTGVVFAQVIEPAIRNRIEAVVFVVHFLLSSVEFIMEFAVTHDDSGYYTTFAVVFALRGTRVRCILRCALP